MIWSLSRRSGVNIFTSAPTRSHRSLRQQHLQHNERQQQHLVWDAATVAYNNNNTSLSSLDASSTFNGWLPEQQTRQNLVSAIWNNNEPRIESPRLSRDHEKSCANYGWLQQQLLMTVTTTNHTNSFAATENDRMLGHDQIPTIVVLLLVIVIVQLPCQPDWSWLWAKLYLGKCYK
jgi:outer membrane PBP1 activator LpoA protein